MNLKSNVCTNNQIMEYLKLLGKVDLREVAQYKDWCLHINNTFLDS